MKKILNYILAFCLAATVILGHIPITAHAANGSISISGVPSSVNIGDSISVTVTATADVDALIQVNISSEEGVLEFAGPGSGVLVLEPSAGGADSATVTYKAVAPGTATISAAVTESYDVITQQGLSISGASASVTVNNAAGGGDTGGGNTGSNTGGGNTGSNTGGGNTGGNTGGGTAQPDDNEPEEPKKSGDNSLRSLTISPGSLSPSFKSSTTKYTASVGADVTSVAVDAQVSNSKATVESVTGNTNLEMGDNQIKIVVKAENGTTATYTITVRRGGATEEPGVETEEPEDTPDTGILIDGIAYQISELLPEDELPEEFTKTFTTYGDIEVEAYSFPYKNLTLFYLIPVDAEDGGTGEDEGSQEGDESTGTGRFFFRNEADNQFFPYINIAVGDTYVLPLPASYAETEAPQGYQETTVAIHEDALSGYQFLDGAAEPTDVNPAEGEQDVPGSDAGSVSQGAANEPSEFYLLYGVNRDGMAGWYHYDAVDVSLQRYQAPIYITEEAPQPDNSAADEAYAELSARYQEEKSRARLTIAVLLFLLVASIFAIVNILIFKGRGKSGKRRRKSKGDIDYIDFDDL